jgi:hypothetical protein
MCTSETRCTKYQNLEEMLRREFRLREVDQEHVKYVCRVVRAGFSEGVAIGKAAWVFPSLRRGGLQC